MPSVQSYRYYGLILAVSLWLVLIVLAPWMKSLEIGWNNLVYALYTSVCHQTAERSFNLAGYPFAVCARCTGLYLGFWLGLLIIPNLKFLSLRLAKQPRIILIFMFPMALDLLFPSLNTHWTRLITGVLASFPVSVFVWWGIAQIGQPVFKRSHS